ncbi:MAG TPA: hypothetical protein DD381_06620 [Lentisphaeria bacterium]|nr:MAG: hypothetical protein A2X47_13160 [Lentisphaerae bacterium GWF2_38_69]HBM15999.1 hypothetical protein [Lentisphaeria bacterium]
MNLQNIKIHFIGCGGIGMLGLALMVLEKGAIVSGSDIEESKNTKLLKSLGARVVIGKHEALNIPSQNEPCIIIYSSAVKLDNPELLRARELNYICYKRGEFLGILAKSFETVISVAGSHGKTTVTSMITYVLLKAGLKPGYYIGGFPRGWEKNASCGNGKTLVAEADESDLSLNFLCPTVGIALNLDNDHAWNVGGLDKLHEGFKKYVFDSRIFLNGSENFPEGFLEELKTNGIEFLERENMQTGESLNSAEYNNLSTVVTVAGYFGITSQRTLDILKTFPGVERRMSRIFDSETLIVLEDYAHHPSEINAVISQVKTKYSDRKLIVLFQPHREKRLQFCFEAFVKELSKADFVFILPVFGAWENTGKKLEEELKKAIGSKSRNISYDWNNSAFELSSFIKPEEKTLLMLLGAGDINQIIKPLVENLSWRFK